MKIKLKKEAVAEKILSLIQDGVFPEGTKLPRGTELAATLGVSHITLRAALAELAGQGVVTLIHGKGTFVTGDGHSRARGKILIIRDSLRSLQSVSNYILPSFEKRCCELQLITETINGDFITSSSNGSFRELLKKNGFTGVLIPGGGFEESDPLAHLLKTCGVFVLIAHGTSRDPERSGLSVMRTDYAAAWSDGVKFLLSCGRKKIAFLGNSIFKIQYYPPEEFVRQFGVLGAVSDSHLVAFATPETASLNDALEQLLKEKPEAIFCGSDSFAMRICSLLAARGIQVPEEIAVLGFGGYPGGNFCTPALSTVDFQYAAIGEKAADILSSPHLFEGAPFDIFTSHKILIRESAKKGKKL